MLGLRRRQFITLLSGAAAAGPFAARAQQAAMPVVGLLSSRSPAVDTPLIAVIRQGLNETGFVEGQNVALDYRWADGQYDRLAGLAVDLVRRQVAAIVALLAIDRAFWMTSRLISDFAKGLLCLNMRRRCCCYRAPTARQCTKISRSPNGKDYGTMIALHI
jgi:hypothetical protein